MSDDRDKLLGIMNNLESDYKSGKISAEKYSYFRSKYEDKLNSIDARDATKRIRSMQGKPSTNSKKKRSKKPTKNKRKEEQDLVQKYIINPKKSDAKYNKKKKSGMDSGTFKLLLILILVIGFTAGTAYGIFNFDFGSISQEDSVAVVDDTAFPEFKNDVKLNTTSMFNTTYSNYSYYDDADDDKDIETTTSSSNVQTTTDSSSSSSSNTHQDTQQSSSSDSGSNTPSSQDGGSSSEGSETTGGEGEN